MKLLFAVCLIAHIFPLIVAISDNDYIKNIFYEQNGAPITPQASPDTSYVKARLGAGGVGIATIDTSPCDGDQGNGKFLTLEVDNCESTGACIINVIQQRGSRLNFTAGKSYPSMKLSVHAFNQASGVPKTFLSETWYLDRPYIKDYNYDFDFDIFFGGSWTNKGGDYDIQLRLWSEIDNGTSICQTFPITLDGTTNAGSFYGAKCITVDKPCAFKKSMCVKVPFPPPGEENSLTCRCAPDAFWENVVSKWGCKQVVGSSCEKSDDCISNAECTSQSGSGNQMYAGTCNCSKGFVSNPDEPQHCYATETNQATHPGEMCTVVAQPCAFDNSVCVDDGKTKTCQCDTTFHYETGRGCKKQIAASCNNNEDCISHAECVKQSSDTGICQCSEGYDFVDANTCNNANGVVVLSIFLLLASQLSAFVRTIF